MTVSVKISNSVCRNACEYCYEAVIRKKGRSHRPLNVDAVLEQMEKEMKTRNCGTPYLHGGEALSVGKETVETILKRAKELSSSNTSSIQTYGHLLDRDYFEMFKKYNTHVGISIDGPWPLNKLRKVPGKDTQEVTNKVMQNILQMKNMGISVGIICILHTENALGENLEKLKEWLLWLRDNDITGGRLNPASVYDYALEYQLTPTQAKEAWLDLAEFIRNNIPNHSWKPFRDVFDNMLGLAQGTCIFDVCQFYHAHTEPVILSDGKTANCFKPGIRTGHVYPRYTQYKHWQDPNKRFGKIRYDILPNVEKKDGGCKGCKYWRNCLGGCAGNTIDNDWRNRTKFCEAYYGLLEYAEKELRSTAPNLILTTDEGVIFSDEYGVKGMIPRAFDYVSQSQQRRSIWRGATGKKRFIQAAVEQCRQHNANNNNQTGDNPAEHLDGDVRHLDSDQSKSNIKPSTNSKDIPDKRMEHVDGDIRHLDSDYSDNS